MAVHAFSFNWLARVFFTLFGAAQSVDINIAHSYEVLKALSSTDECAQKQTADMYAKGRGSNSLWSLFA